MRGGYIILDLKNTAFTSAEAANVAGAYDAASNPYGKATLVSGLVVGDVAYPDFYATFVASGSSYEASVVIGGETITIEVEDGDDVTVTVA